MDNTVVFLYIGVFAVIYIFFILPNKKKQKEQKKFLEELKKGDKVVTSGGIHGKIVELKDTTCVIDTGGGMKLKVNRPAINMEASALLTPDTEIKKVD